MDEPTDPSVTMRFTGISGKLNAPKKVSQFEKARQEAESKRLRDEAEAEAALKEFEDSFGDGEDDRREDRARPGARGDPQPRGPRGGIGPPPSMKRKRELEQLAEMRRDWGDVEEDRLQQHKRRSPEPGVRKPTMLLHALPLSFSGDAIRRLFRDLLRVEKVSVVNPSRHPQGQPGTKAVLVSTTSATPASDVDKAVSQLQGKYLGFGRYLKILRYVSGTLSDTDASMLFAQNKNIFGATPKFTIEEPQSKHASGYNRAAPPAAFSAAALPSNKRSSNALSVSVNVPSDIKLVRLIHQTVERLIDHGPDFEAMLMSRPEVQQDEKWSWLYDSTSSGGVYYRWLLWQSLTSAPTADEVFDAGPVWQAPLEPLQFAGVTNMRDLCEDADYISSDEDSEDDNAQLRAKDSKLAGQLINIEDVGSSTFDAQNSTLNPYRRANLTHLLARLPPNITTLRSGDVARITAFVVKNAGQGPDEIVDMLLCNVEQPFHYSVKYDDEPTDPLSEHEDRDKDSDSRPDHSNAQLIGLYIISDVLLSSSTSGVRDAWKYRNLLEGALLGRRTFEKLGRLEKELAWGRMKGEQWKRKVGVVFDVWNSASVFPADVLRGMKKSFLEPPLSAEEQKAKEAEDLAEREAAEKVKWKSAATAPVPEHKADAVDDTAAKEMTEEEKRSEAMQRIAALKAKLAGDVSSRGPEANEQGNGEATPQAAHAGRRSRPTAEDLFDAPEESPLPLLEPEPAVPAAPISFALGGSGPSGPSIDESDSKPAVKFGGFGLGTRSPPSKAPVAPKSSVNMFDDESDEE